jgi:hypothetical protein
MKKSTILSNLMGVLAIVGGAGACDVERRTVESSGIGELRGQDSGTTSRSEETSRTNVSDAGAADDGSNEDSGTMDIDVTLVDAQVADSASDAQPPSPVGDGGPDAGQDGGIDAGEPETIVELPARGYYVVESDYETINVSVWNSTGGQLSSSLISSSSEDPGLSAPFTSDVVPPSEQQVGDEVVLIDRTSGVLTWVNLETATVRQQLDVKTGFASDPHDYVAYDENTAFVPRFGENGASGVEPFDRGSDLLVINPSSGEITGSIDLSSAMQGDSRPASPDRAILAGGLIRVLLVGWDGVSTFAPARLVSVDPVSRQITNVLVLDGVQNCTTIALSPTATTMALACWGPWSSEETLTRSGIVQLSVADEPKVLRSIPATELGNEQINTVAFTSASTVIYSTFGRSDYDTYELLAPDTLRFLDLQTGLADDEPVIALTSAFALGDIRCSTVGKRCLVADATGDGSLRHLTIAADGRVTDVTPDTEDAEVHEMQPRYLGAF